MSYWLDISVTSSRAGRQSAVFTSRSLSMSTPNIVVDGRILAGEVFSRKLTADSVGRLAIHFQSSAPLRVRLVAPSGDTVYVSDTKSWDYRTVQSGEWTLEIRNMSLSSCEYTLWAS